MSRNAPEGASAGTAHPALMRQGRKDNSMENINNNEMKKAYECIECGQVLYLTEEEASSGLDDRGDFVCEECREAYSLCNDCDSWVRLDEGYTVNPGCWAERLVCDDCIESYYRCDECEEYFDREYVSCDRGNGRVVCDGCFESLDLRTCSDCGAIIDDSYYEDDDLWGESPYCLECFQEREARRRRTQRGLNRYGYKPLPKFMRNDGYESFRWDEVAQDGFELGIELETDEGDRDVIAVINDLTERLYAKSDSSLRNGVEWVSHPATLRAHKKHMPWAEVMKLCKQYGYGSHDPGTCGLHIHVSSPEGKDERNELVAKLMVFMIRHHDTIHLLSRRRGENGHARFIDDNALSYLADEMSHWDYENVVEDLGDRYHWLNNENDHTIEFRMWRGTLRYESFMAALEMTDAMVRYCFHHTIKEVVNSKFEDILDEGEYEYVLDYIEYRGGTREPREINIPRRLKIGDIVLCQLEYGTEYNLPAFGVVEARPLHYGWNSRDVFGVRFPNWSKGHNLDDQIATKEGWYIHRKYLEVWTREEAIAFIKGHGFYYEAGSDPDMLLNSMTNKQLANELNLI